MPLLFQIFVPLYFAAPACFYLYIKGFIHNRKTLAWDEWLHFLPALLAVIHVIPWPHLAPLNWDIITKQFCENGYLSLHAKNGLFPSYFQYIVRPLLIISYLALSWYAVIRSKISERINIDDPGRNWILFLLRVATFFQLTSLIPIVLRSMNIPIYNTFFIILNCIVLLVILMYALHHPHFFYGYLLVATDWNQKDTLNKSSVPKPISDDNQLPLRILPPEVTALTQKKLNLPIQQISLYAVLIKDAMEKEQLYLQPDLQIIDVANLVNIPVHHCSYVINNHIGKNFRDWINSYRIDHFLKEYPLQREKKTIEALAKESGFKSQATFYNAFKKEKGAMPTNYFLKNQADRSP
ncbi:helix-turn-helix domain-containing protein [Pedobacter psychrotolerans]|uniref:helix-turn-helix domain-containing protein n=1 Tax=Pedobacter psychrotolerans TaxID=1843235 RepID=UPI0016655C39|nr:helix-turn-helix domain-containing protein [Pedobacter psychrotolerans]